MADEQRQSTEVMEQEPQGTPQAETTDWKAEARKWEARAKQNKEKANKYDKAEVEAKSDLQKVTERADKLQARLDEIEEQREREKAVKETAERYGVDEETLARMGGDVEENAAFLKGRQPKAPAYPQVNDNGEVSMLNLFRNSRSHSTNAERFCERNCKSPAFQQRKSRPKAASTADARI